MTVSMRKLLEIDGVDTVFAVDTESLWTMLRHCHILIPAYSVCIRVKLKLFSVKCKLKS